MLWGNWPQLSLGFNLLRCVKSPHLDCWCNNLYMLTTKSIGDMNQWLLARVIHMWVEHINNSIRTEVMVSAHTEINLYYAFTSEVWRVHLVLFYQPGTVWSMDQAWWRHQLEKCRVTGPLCGKLTGHRWIPRTKASDAELWCFLWSAPE